LLILAQYRPELTRWMREVADNDRLVQVCQGDVTVTIMDDGRLEVTPEFANACGFRGDYDDLLAARWGEHFGNELSYRSSDRV
jgi:hypothetical protein